MRIPSRLISFAFAALGSIALVACSADPGGTNGDGSARTDASGHNDVTGIDTPFGGGDVGPVGTEPGGDVEL